MMYSIEFYEDEKGNSEVWSFLEELRVKSKNNKDARIQFRQISLQLELLKNNGTHQPADNVKHIEDGIWEIRPGSNRVFFFHFKDGKFVLLHHYRKKTQKAPKLEIERAKVKRDDYIRLMEGRK